jgi:glycosyltransferase involved in cell wall biosynthesis
MQIILVPVYNEEKSIFSTLTDIRGFYKNDILIINDGSTDDTLNIIQSMNDSKINILSNKTNYGYGASLIKGFKYAIQNKYTAVVTFDGDGQHDATIIPDFFANLAHADIVSGSRYTDRSLLLSEVPKDRLIINKKITSLINQHTNYNISDSFCGFKSYKVSALKKLSLSEKGYAFPIQCWIQAYRNNLSIIELPVPNLYLDLTRTFNDVSNDPSERLAYYKSILEKNLEECHE